MKKFYRLITVSGAWLYYINKPYKKMDFKTRKQAEKVMKEIMTAMKRPKEYYVIVEMFDYPEDY